MRLTDTDRLPSSPLVRFLRWWLPAIICLCALVFVIARGGDEIGLEGGAGIMGAGLSLLLMNWLWRVGVAGESERHEEDAARAYFDRHGRWPDEDATPGRRPPGPPPGT